MPTVVVVGGGISGLSAAWELASCSAPGTRIVVLEASDRVGGLLQSESIGGRQVDVGADAFLARRPEAIELCRELEISSELVSPASSNAAVWSRGAIRRLPEGLVLGVPTRIGPLSRSSVVSALGAARAALDLVMPARRERSASPPDRSVGEIVSRRLGDQVSDHLTGPLVGGINAGNANELSAEAVFPALIEAARQGGSLMRALRRAPSGTGPHGETPVFLTPRAGMASLPQALAAALRRRGVDVLTSQPVETLQISGASKDAAVEASSKRWTLSTPTQTLQADGIVMATPASVASKLLVDVHKELATLLGGVTSASVVLVTFVLDPVSLIRPLEGNGFLVPAGRGLVTACTYLSSKWPHLAREDEVLVRASAGRAGDDRAISMHDEEIVSEVLGELERMLGHVGRFDVFEGLAGFGALGKPRQVVVTRYPDAFPQYLLGHLDRVAAMEGAAASLPGLALAGASYRGIGVPACVESGRRAARLVAEATNPT
jgi:protoporphyrinogen/coproporphyrinogen III oxidase